MVLLLTITVIMVGPEDVIVTVAEAEASAADPTAEVNVVMEIMTEEGMDVMDTTGSTLEHLADTMTGATGAETGTGPGTTKGLDCQGPMLTESLKKGTTAILV